MLNGYYLPDLTFNHLKIVLPPLTRVENFFSQTCPQKGTYPRKHNFALISKMCITLATISASKNFLKKTLLKGDGTLYKVKSKIRKKSFNLKKIL
jgi:hypothetical protein